MLFWNRFIDLANTILSISWAKVTIWMNLAQKEGNNKAFWIIHGRFLWLSKLLTAFATAFVRTHLRVCYCAASAQPVTHFRPVLIWHYYYYFPFCQFFANPKFTLYMEAWLFSNACLMLFFFAWFFFHLTFTYLSLQTWAA